MTENISLQSSGRFNFARIVEVLLQPQRTFALLAEEARPGWSTPMLILSVSAFLGVIGNGLMKAVGATNRDVLTIFFGGKLRASVLSAAWAAY